MGQVSAQKTHEQGSPETAPGRGEIEVVKIESPQMLVVTPFHPGDADQALRLAEWIREIGGGKGHNLLLIRDTRCAPDISERIKTAFADSFDSVEVLDCVDHFKSWPRSPNAVFSMAARHIAANQNVPWFFCEPDCILLKSDGFSLIEAEYATAVTAGKRFLGDFVHVPELQDVPDHMSGNAVYPGNMFQYGGLALLADEIAFDVQAASQIVPQMHKSKHILHRWKHAAFETWEQVQQAIFDVKPAAVLFHADKNGSLFPLLMKKVALRLPDSLSQCEPITTTIHSVNGLTFKDGMIQHVDWTEFERDTRFTGPPANDSRDAIVRDAVAVLKQLCTSPVHTGKVRKELKAQGVT